MLRGSRLALGGLILSGLVCLGLFVMTFGPDWLVHWREFRDGEALKEKVESFRREKGRLPTERESGVSEREPYYRPCPDGSYIIWFGTTLGESMTYESRKGKWLDVSGGCTDFDQ